MAAKKSNLKVFALGGLQEMGKNITVFEYGNDILIVDCGVGYPEDEMLGIDLVIPDFTYLVKNKDKVKGIVLTHGHDDHIGAIPYLCRVFDVPIYGTRLTLGMLEITLKEFDLVNKVKRICANMGDTINIGCFGIEFIETTHSIADSAALAISTPVGMIVHSGDFKIDHTPINGNPINLQRFAELGKSGVLLFLCESTNVVREGFSASEQSVGVTLENIFNNYEDRRILIATYSANIHRLRQVINSATLHGRKLAVASKTMLTTMKYVSELGYLDIPEGLIIEVSEINKYKKNELVVLMSGSQGDPVSALSKLLVSDTRNIGIRDSDVIIISASSSYGNEKAISKVINDLLLKGAEVIHERSIETHVSGHARKEELKLMHTLLNAKYVIPNHGEYKHLKQHKDLLVDLGFHKENIFVMNNGEVLELTDSTARINGTVPVGQVMIDGLGVGDVGSIVLRDRTMLSQDGLIIVVISIEHDTGMIVSGPEIITRGFVYVKESEELMEEAYAVVTKALEHCENSRITDWSHIKTLIKDSLRQYVWQKTKRNPMILPVIMDV